MTLRSCKGTARTANCFATSILLFCLFTFPCNINYVLSIKKARVSGEQSHRLLILETNLLLPSLEKRHDVDLEQHQHKSYIWEKLMYGSSFYSFVARKRQNFYTTFWIANHCKNFQKLLSFQAPLSSNFSSVKTWHSEFFHYCIYIHLHGTADAGYFFYRTSINISLMTHTLQK